MGKQYPVASRRLGELVRAARVDAGLKQEELARRVGCGTSTVRGIEAGRGAGTSILTVFELLCVLGEDVSALAAAFKEVQASVAAETAGKKV